MKRFIEKAIKNGKELLSKAESKRTNKIKAKTKSRFLEIFIFRFNNEIIGKQNAIPTKI